MERLEARDLLARWFCQDECRSAVSEEDEQSAASLLRFLNHIHGVYLRREMPAGYYVAGQERDE